MRVFDRVHGEVDLHPLLARIVNTPEFNRLDGIRQLGTCAMLYPSATHTRLEHAIGVSHLATVLCKRLQSQHPELISEDDILCTGLAGLVHDLGHGPFSHAFENYMRSQGYRWNHEEAGLEVLTHLLEMNEIRLVDYFEGNCAEVIERVRGMVLGTDTGTQKEFLYEIVHARKTGIDVDKLDYLARDSLAVFGTHTVDFKRILSSCKVVEGRLAYDERVAFDVADVYGMRARLHRRVYQHRSVVRAESILCELMRALDACLPPEERLTHLAFSGEGMCLLTDGYILSRAYANDPKLSFARPMWRALVTASPLVQVSVVVCINTHPRCAKCSAPTEIEHAYCTKCGETTDDRPFLRRDGYKVPLENNITSCSATADVYALMPHDVPGGEHVRVHITDVHCGAKVQRSDPYGGRWVDFDPVVNVPFVSKKGELLRMRSDMLHVPALRFSRAAYCYAPVAIEDVASQAFIKWGMGVGNVDRYFV